MVQETSFRTAVSGFNKSDVMLYIEKLMTENSEQKNRIEALEKELDVCKAARERAEDDAAKAVHNACENCEKAKSAEAQLGATMLDAKRFSELLLKDANDRAAAVLNSALCAVSASSDTANELARDVKKVREDFNKTLGELCGEMTSVILRFADFSSALEKRGYDFIYHTDFSTTKKPEEG